MVHRVYHTHILHQIRRVSVGNGKVIHREITEPTDKKNTYRKQNLLQPRIFYTNTMLTKMSIRTAMKTACDRNTFLQRANYNVHFATSKIREFFLLLAFSGGPYMFMSSVLFLVSDLFPINLCELACFMSLNSNIVLFLSFFIFHTGRNAVPLGIRRRGRSWNGWYFG